MRFVAAFAAMLFFCGPAFGLAPHLNLAQLYHTQWTPREGAPSDVEALAQTKDGYLWIGTPAGLFRFDGVRFERVESMDDRPLLSSEIYSLWAPPEGGLWIGHRFGGATFIKDGRLINYSQAEGLPPTSLLTIAQDGQGSVWAGTLRGMFRLSEGHWVSSRGVWNLPDGPVYLLRLDGQGTLWTVVGNAVLFLRRGDSQFTDAGFRLPSSYDASFVGTSVSSDGVLWLCYLQEDGVSVLHAPGDGRKIALHVDSTSKSTHFGSYNLIDRDGQFWFWTGDGIRRLAMGKGTSAEMRWQESRHGKVVALTGSNAYAIVEDREGNVWVGTPGGLDSFRAPALARVDVPDEEWLPMVRGDDDGILVGAMHEEMFRVAAGVMPEPVPPPPVKDRTATFSAFYRDPQGDLWIASVGTATVIWHRHAGRWRPLPRPPEIRIAASDGVVQSLAMDSAGAMWVSIVQEGVYRVVGDKWIPFGERADLPRAAPSVIAADAQKRIWLGYTDGRVLLLENDRVTAFSTDQGLDVGAVLAVAARDNTAWIGGARGLAWFDGQHFHSVRRAGGRGLPGIAGIVEMADDSLWLGTAEGAMHIGAADVDRVRRDADHLIAPAVLGHLDGMPGVPYSVRPLPSVISGRDGRVWFTTNNGVVWTDPSLQARNPIVPTVLVNSLDADGERHTTALQQPVVLRPRAQNLQFSYTALSLTVPERVQFKYRLEGHDSAWQNPGTRREAFYNNLAPGHYRFRVIASNNDGLWNEEGATVDFVIPPTFVQTWWFTLLWVVAISGLMLLVFTWWLRQAQAQLRSRLTERLVERERIARDLHDTFLQGVQGLMLRFQTAAERIPPDEPARAFMEDALNRADRVLADGRRKISTLRSAETKESEIAEDLRTAGEEQTRGSSISFDFSVDGTPRLLHPVVKEEALRICAEALANARQHACATRIGVRLEFSNRALLIEIVDDGRGFDVSMDRESAGHWGLRGMRERAARIRAHLDIRSLVGDGTRLALTIAGETAYAPAVRTIRRGARRFWKIGRRRDEP